MPDWPAIRRALGTTDAAAAAPRPVAGGDISPAWRVSIGDGAAFVKTAALAHSDMFAAEAEGLAELAAAGALHVPNVLAHGEAGDSAFLALEWLVLEPANDKVQRLLGEQLAQLHQTTAARFGWHRDKTIGATPQPNAWSDDWIGFLGEHRLGYQLELAAAAGHRGELQTLGTRLMSSLDGFFDGYRPQPSLLHGDLWGGNWAACGGAPLIFDPAVYYGDREADLAMTRLFGGFGRSFHDAYETRWPLADGHRARDALYRLYHVLNHLNLFGGGYRSQALGLMHELLGA